ncbi:MAG TPA: DUF4339 domain-containing protein [Fluviicola sp.]|nr:DUF4339 domain-containing protein [Fluviicola sp.]
MKKYYIFKEAAQLGPFDLEDLRSQNITKDTPIWFEGLSDWTVAGKIEEISELFDSPKPPPFRGQETPPPFKSQPAPQVVANKPVTVKKRNLCWFCLFVDWSYFGCNHSFFGD